MSVEKKQIKENPEQPKKPKVIKVCAFRTRPFIRPICRQGTFS